MDAEPDRNADADDNANNNNNMKVAQWLLAIGIAGFTLFSIFLAATREGAEVKKD